MQRDKNTKKAGQIAMIGKDSSKMTDILSGIIDQFAIRKTFSVFNPVKRSGIIVSNALMILLMLPFWSIASVGAIFKSGFTRPESIEGQKDVYYDIKNNERINWRLLLYLLVKRFRY